MDPLPYPQTLLDLSSPFHFQIPVALQVLAFSGQLFTLPGHFSYVCDTLSQLGHQFPKEIFSFKKKKSIILRERERKRTSRGGAETDGERERERGRERENPKLCT